MLLSRVIVTPDTLHTCLTHALSTEHQEIMGLLLGSLINNNTEAFITRSMVLSRKDKKKDRVEVSYNDLGLASTVAEDLSLRVVGWYHSHPHITVLPSHVDVKTQGQYQALGEFLGLIFSVFDKGQLEMCAFQSRQNRNGDWERVEIPVVVSHSSGSVNESLQCERRLLESLIAMQMVLMNEDKETFQTSQSTHAHGHSHLSISRTMSVHQASLCKLLDIQICPLLMAMRSKVATLQYERDKLLKELETISDENNDVINENDVKHDIPDITIISDSREEFEKALLALERTIPKWTRSRRALKMIFAGLAVEIISAELSKVHRGERYSIKVQRMTSSSSLVAIKSPWLLHFEHDETEVEDESESKKKSFSVPLLAVRTSSSPDNVEFVVLQPLKPHVNSSKQGYTPPLGVDAKCVVVVRVSSCLEDPIDGTTCAGLIGECLHSSLHLNLSQL
jgi:BRCA1/BRCA2-containing complex subunit 3